MGTSPPLSGYRIPAWLLAIYGVLFTALGWFGAGIWADYQTQPRSAKPDFASVITIPAALMQQETPPPCAEGELMPLRYSAHVYADEPQRRSVTLNGRQYREGDTLTCGGEIVEIQQALTILRYDGRTVLLDALEDWPGGPPENTGDEG